MFYMIQVQLVKIFYDSLVKNDKFLFGCIFNF